MYIHVLLHVHTYNNNNVFFARIYIVSVSHTVILVDIYISANSLFPKIVFHDVISSKLYLVT